MRPAPSRSKSGCSRRSPSRPATRPASRSSSWTPTASSCGSPPPRCIPMKARSWRTRCSPRCARASRPSRRSLGGAAVEDPAAGDPFDLVLAQEALEEPSVPLLVMEHVDHHVLGDRVDPLGLLDYAGVVLYRAGLGLDHAADHVNDVGLLLGRLEV